MVMNLAAYDKVEQNITKTWINPRYNRIYSNELEHYSFYTFLKKYNKENDCFDYFLAMYNKPIKDNNGIWHNSQKDGWEFPVNKSVNSYEKIEEDTEPVDLTDTINAFLNYV